MSLFRPSRRSAPESRGFTTGNVGLTTLGDTISDSLRLVPLYSAVSLIAEALSTAPVHEFADRGGGRVRINDDPVVREPGVGLDRISWVCQAVSSLLLRGNAYGLGTGLDVARPSKVMWLPPDMVTVDESGAFPEYYLAGQHIDRGLITHLRGHVLPGSCVGLSPISLFRTQLQTGRRVDVASSEWYGQATNPRGILSRTDRALEPDEIETTKQRYKESVKSGDILVTGNDWRWQSLTVSPADAQFVGQAQMTANQIAAIYHVPAEEIGGTTGNSLTYSTVELNGIKFNQRAILPWAARLEQAWSSWVAQPRYVRFNLDATLRVDLKTRMDAYAVALKNGVYTQDRVRALENEPPMTEQEVTDWQEHYVKPGAAQPAADPASAPPTEGKPA